MSIIAYLTLTGAKQGVIKGGVTAKGRDGTIAVAAVTHEMTNHFFLKDSKAGSANLQRLSECGDSPSEIYA